MTTKDDAGPTSWQSAVRIYNDFSDIVIGSSPEATVDLCVDHFVDIAAASIARNGRFTVALSGGSTPKAIFKALASAAHRSRIDWQHCWLFWSDERAVPPDHSDSNYHMAMSAGFGSLPIPAAQIFRMHTEDDDYEAYAHAYELAIKAHVVDGHFDLMMLGVGDDGHTASLFPGTHALAVHNRLAVANYVPSKGCWRMTLTFECINNARNIAIYAIGKSKASIVYDVLAGLRKEPLLPTQRVGTDQHHALWFIDAEAASRLRL
jgi:6-phosphogluconolactonase